MKSEGRFYQQFGFHHFHDGIFDPFTAEPGVFKAPVGHMVDTEGGHIVDNYPALIKAAGKVKRVGFHGAQ